MKLILICGKADSGKDMFGEILKEEYVSHKKKACILKITEPLYRYARDYFGWDGKDSSKPRSLLQELGTDVIKEKMGMTTFLLDRLRDDINILNNYFEVGIITDGRLISECEYLKKNFNNVKVIKLVRNADNKLSDKEKKHITETDLDNDYEFDYIVENTSKKALTEKAKEIFTWERTYEIAIDGPCAVGKSTVAKQIAKKLGFLYIDTGAMFRALALHMVNKKIDFNDEKSVCAELKNANVDIKYNKEGEQVVYLNKKDVNGLIRTSQVSEGASIISTYGKVREKLLSMQRELAYKNNVIMDGRDIGTVVLPNADLKIYLTSDENVRAQRRKLDYELKGISMNLDEVKKELLERDYRDTHRENAPLRKANDAVVVDNSNCTIDELRDQIIDLFNEKRK